MRAADGRGPRTTLLPAYFQKLGIASTDELVAKVYAPQMSREQLAALASVVFDYRSTDDVAAKIVDQAAAELAEIVCAVARRLNLLDGRYVLAFAGGAILHQPNFLDRITAAVGQRSTQEKMAPTRHLYVVENPVAGAMQMARSLAAG
jgi:N-acetylglucosamine kinase-like BadF-type ATPase